MSMIDDNYELREIEKLEGHTDRVWSVAWHPSSGVDGAPFVFASCSGDKTVRVWEMSNDSQWHCKAVLDDRHSRTVRSCSWSPCGKMLATGSFDATTAVWEYIGGEFECVSSLEGHENEVKSVSWNATSTLLATCSRDKTVWIWEVMPGNEYDCVAVLQGHKQDVKMVQWHPNFDVLFSCSYDNTIKVWWTEDSEHENWECMQTLDEDDSGHSSTVWALSLNSNGDKMVTCSDDLTIKIWAAAEMEKMICGDGYADWAHVCTLSGYHDRTIFSVHWSSDDIIATGAADDCIQLFVENKDGEIDGPSYSLLTKKDKAHDMDVNSVQWSPGGTRLLASGSDDGTIKIWQLEKRETIPCKQEQDDI